MENINECSEVLKKIMDLLEIHFGTNCEIVLHDLTLGYDKCIVDIRNGHVTGRKVGGCSTNLGIEIDSGVRSGNDQFNYITYAGLGKILKSSSIYFCNSKGKLIGSLCVNLDITESVKFENSLRNFNGYSESDETREYFTSDIQQLMEKMIMQAMEEHDNPPISFTKQQKMQVIEHLDKQGVFLITKAGERVCQVLGISKPTLYNYLDIIHKKTDEETGSGKDRVY